MTRRPTGPVDAALATIQTWMQETKRMVDALRGEVEELRYERLELQAQLRFATDQANREVLAAASLKQELESVRALPVLSKRELSSFEDEQTDVEPLRSSVPTLRRVRGDATQKTTRRAS